LAVLAPRRRGRWWPGRSGNGYEATKLIEADPALKHIPIIVVTSYALSGDEAKAKTAGCDSCVAKPFSPRALLDKIRQFAG
jgi:two-component system, cell cycle response regulator DivK